MISEGEVGLSRWEHLEYKWLDGESFIEEIDWFGDKGELVRVIEQ